MNTFKEAEVLLQTPKPAELGLLLSRWKEASHLLGGIYLELTVVFKKILALHTTPMNKKQKQ